MFSLGVSKRICLCRNRRHMWRVLVYILFVEITRGKVRVLCWLPSLYVVMFCTYTYAIVGRRWVDYFYFAWHLPNEKMHYTSPFIGHSFRVWLTMLCVCVCVYVCKICLRYVAMTVQWIIWLIIIVFTANQTKFRARNARFLYTSGVLWYVKWPHKRIRGPRYIEKHVPEMKGRLSLRSTTFCAAIALRSCIIL